MFGSVPNLTPLGVDGLNNKSTMDSGLTSDLILKEPSSFHCKVKLSALKFFLSTISKFSNLVDVQICLNPKSLLLLYNLKVNWAVVEIPMFEWMI